MLMEVKLTQDLRMTPKAHVRVQHITEYWDIYMRHTEVQHLSRHCMVSGFFDISYSECNPLGIKIYILAIRFVICR